MKTNVLIVEDEFPIALDLQTRLENRGFTVVGIAANYKQALTLLSECEYDIILLDINLEEAKSGIDLGVIIKNKFHKPIIFITAYSDEKTFSEAIIAQPMGYITKPINDDDLYRSIIIALSRFKDLNDQLYSGNTFQHHDGFVFIKERGVAKKVYCKDILWIKAMDNYSIIHTAQGRFVVSAFLKDILGKLGDSFVRIHRSHAVSIDKITAYDDGIVYVDSVSLKVGNHYKRELSKKLNIL